MLNVCCVMVNNYAGRGREYVEKLHDMVRRNLPAGFPGRFVCFTDDPEALKGLAGVDVQTVRPGMEGWWNKLSLFAPESFIPGDRVLYFDLDTVITGPLDFIDAPAYPEFAILKDAYRPEGLQSSVMMWIAGEPEPSMIWYDYQMRKKEAERLSGDQNWIEHVFVEHHIPVMRLQDIFPGKFASYKVSCVDGVPRGTSVVFFHGHPRPHEAQGWVEHIWKIGGGSGAELVLVGTVAQDKILANVKENLGHPYAVLQEMESIKEGEVAVICGGGPSLRDHIPELKSLEAGGAFIFACNNVDRYLRQEGVIPDYHVMLDARPDLSEWIYPVGTKLYASTCDPSVLEMGHAVGDLVMWHPMTDGIGTLVPHGMVIGGGTTVGCLAMTLAYALGFRKIMCVGFDSCYRADDHHAYPQALNDGERIIDAIHAGKTFKCAPWMVQQAEDWHRLVLELHRKGCTISVYGEGLIPTIARTMSEPYTQIDGIWWPSDDRETRLAVMGTLPDLRDYVKLCSGKRTVIQAGGNVGVWAKELAREFQTVITFEPDPRNVDCMLRNVTELNVRMYPFALGNVTDQRCGLGHIDGNSGASFVLPEDDSVPDDQAVQMMCIDSLGLESLDLLILDIEGYEYHALLGALQTIRQCSPVIVLELKGLGSRYGYSDSVVYHLLESLGYQKAGAAHRDVIFQKVAS